jgi:O-antigen/teichoic acid export membrane protein
LYNPDALGTAETFFSILSVLGVIASLRYELAIMLPEYDEEAANVLAVSLLIALVTSGLSLLIVALARGPIAQLLNAPDLERYLWLMPLAVAGNGVFLTLSYWNSRLKEFSRLAIAQVSQSVVMNTSQLAAGGMGSIKAGGLVGGRVLGITTVSIVLGGQIWRDDRELFTKKVRWHRMFKLAKRYRKFPLFTFWSALLNTVSWQLPTFLLTYFVSPTIVGYYALGYLTLRAPISVVGNAIAQVFFQRASEVQKAQGDLSDITAPLFRWLVALGLFPMLLLTVIGKEIFVILFGQTWAEAGIYTQILSPWMLFVFISSPLSTLFSVLERQEGALLFNALLFISRLITLVGGGVLGEPRLALLFFASSGVILYGALSTWILRTSGVSGTRVVQVVTKYLLISVGILSPIIFLKLIVAPRAIILLVVSALCFGMYALILMREEPTLVTWLKKLVRIE